MNQNEGILSREMRMFKPLFWLCAASALMLAGVMAVGATRPAPRAPGYVVLSHDEAVRESDVKFELLEAPPVELPSGLRALKTYRLELSEGAAFSHPVTLNFYDGAEGLVLMLSDTEWVVVESTPGQHPEVARTVAVSSPGVYALAVHADGSK